MESASASILSEWAVSLCQHLQHQRAPAAPLSVLLPKLLAPACERHLRTILETAHKFARRARRSTVTVEDINAALSLHHQEVGGAYWGNYGARDRCFCLQELVVLTAPARSNHLCK